jgi:hypothetical protein
VNWFQTGGGPGTLPGLGCFSAVAVFAGVIFFIVWGTVIAHFIVKFW